MATNVERIVKNLTAFYDFAGRTVVAVGAGGGQLVEYARQTLAVIAVDKDGAAIRRLARRADECGLADRFTLVQGDLLTVRPRGDVVLFEFCLHEMSAPDEALGHAKQLAPDVLVLDHAAGSPWSWCAAEEAGVEAGWAAVARMAVRRGHKVEAFQRFTDYAELEAKMAQQGPTSLERIAPYRAQTAIVIPMPYRLALL